MSDETQSKSALATVQRGPGGLQLNTFEALWSFSQCIVRSGMAPKGLDTQDKIVIALELGSELGLKPLQSLQNIAVINGRPCVYGDAMLAICQGSAVWDSSAFKEWYTPEGGTVADADYAAHCQVRRSGSNSPIECVFSVEDAKRAKLWGKQGPWTDYPQRMLMWRARTWACRNAFADVLKGVNIAEEVQDYPDVIDAPTQPSLPAPSSRGDAIAAMAAPSKPAPAPTVAPAERSEPEPDTPPEAVETIYVTEEQTTQLRDAFGRLDRASQLAFAKYSGCDDAGHNLSILPADQFDEVMAELNAAYVLPDKPVEPEPVEPEKPKVKAKAKPDEAVEPEQAGTPISDAEPAILPGHEFEKIKAAYATIDVVAKQSFRAFAFGSSNTMFADLAKRPSNKTFDQLMAWFEAQKGGA